MRFLQVLAIGVLSGLVAVPGFADGGSPCSEREVTASAVRSAGDVQAFVECAKHYLDHHGPEEARRAFNEDERWKHGSIYVFVDEIAESGKDAFIYVYPPDPSREGQVWGESIDDFGTDLYAETYRMMESTSAGWTYYSFKNPETGGHSPKRSYVIEVDWNGDRAMIGAGLYAPDWPGTCGTGEVNASALKMSPSSDALRAFVRCAAAVVASEGYFAKQQIETDPRWSDGSVYVYVLDMMGNQIMTGSRFRVNGRSLYEWGRRDAVHDQFGGRDMLAVGHAFGEAEIYYEAFNPDAGRPENKVGFVKRVVSQGVPLLVGSGYYLDGATAMPVTPCAANRVSASAVRSTESVQAFVQCATEYAMEHGTEEARRAFNEDARWQSGPTYLFVDGLATSGENSLTHVFPPEPAREGSLWGALIDSFGNDYFFELNRSLSIVDRGWVHYAFVNFETGLAEPKSSYVVKLDWNGDRVALGAGYYAPDFPGACRASEVNAMSLEANPSDAKLEQFVRCAAGMVESSGLFAGPVLQSDPRWNHGSVYVFVIDTSTGIVRFSSNEASYAVSGKEGQLALFGGRDMLAAAELFGEMYWYYNFTDPVTGQLRPKVSFVKVVDANGLPTVVGAGYNSEPAE